MIICSSVPRNEVIRIVLQSPKLASNVQFILNEIGGVLMYAIIATGGKQYKVTEGDIIRVEKLGVEAGDKVTFDQVLLVSGDDVKVGAPTVNGASVEADVIDNVKGKKVIVYKYKRKTGYHKKNGHRQQLTAVKITKINA